MVDEDGYRPNVGIIIFNDEGKLLWAKRAGQDAWQFPQGGIQQHEEPEQAVIRELYEEVGLEPEDVDIVTRTIDWLPYRLPQQFIRQNSHPVCIGQKQLWFLLKLLADPGKVRFNCSDKPEFDDWRWISYWEPLDEVIAFKQEVYRLALEEFSQTMSRTLGWPVEKSKRAPVSS